VLRVAKFELKKSRRRYRRSSLVATILSALFAALAGYASIVTGVDSDHGIYSANVEVYDYSFVTSENPDVAVYENSIFVKRSDKSLAAAEELIRILEKSYREEVEKEYGELANPVRGYVVYLNPSKIEVRESKVQNVKETQHQPENNSIKENQHPPHNNSIRIEGNASYSIPEEVKIANYVPPEEIKTPGLVDRMVLAFIFVVPSYFAVQVFSSSLLEDKLLRRIEVLISAVDRKSLVLGKILPYFTFSLLTALLASIYFKSYLAFIFTLPVILLLFSSQCFVVMLSRSYREATFLLLVISLLITIYAFIPAIFSTAIPLSKISPITLLLAHIEGENVAITDIFISFAHYLVMASMLLYFSTKALSPDISYGSELFRKLVEISKLSVRNDYIAFLLAFLSISFAFMAELFAILSLFILPRQLMMPALILCVAVVEEILKGLIIFSEPTLRRAVFTALGFFAGEKILLVFNILQDYSIAFLGQFLLLPLLLHITTAIVISAAVKKGYGTSLAIAVILHAAYDYAVVMLLA